MLQALVASVVLMTTSAAQPADLTRAMDAARSAAAQQRYGSVIELLQPHTNPLPADDDARFLVAAEYGRALFHLARYSDAYHWIVRAAAIRPDNIEVGIYRQAAAFLTGRHDEAFALFEQILRSGAQDLWLPITLCGEDRFLAEPRARQLLREYARTLPIDLQAGGLAGAQLGDSRDAVVAALGASGGGDGRYLSARSGPVLLWSLEFDDDNRLIGATVNVTGMVRYSTLRPSLDNRLDWRATPAAAADVLGSATSRHTSEGDSITMTWQLDTVDVEMVFAAGTSQLVPEAAADRSGQLHLELLRVTLRDNEGAS
jgi:tetratricopeptide (TPR) repeat protein